MTVKICLSLLLPAVLYAQSIKIYFYTTETNVDNFKSLKVSFDSYLSRYGPYDFQPFHDKRTFEEHIKDEDAVVILSSWHYKKIYQKYQLDALLVASKNEGIKDTKVLVGKSGIPSNGIVTSAYDIAYTDELVKELFPANTGAFNILLVPKEIDALMSVGFGMSTLALVSKDSYEYLQKLNPAMAGEMRILHASSEGYRMLLAAHKADKTKKNIVSIFKKMHLSKNGRKQLSLLGIDKMNTISPRESSLIRGVE